MSKQKNKSSPATDTSAKVVAHMINLMTRHPDSTKFVENSLYAVRVGGEFVYHVHPNTARQFPLMIMETWVVWDYEVVPPKFSDDGKIEATEHVLLRGMDKTSHGPIVVRDMREAVRCLGGLATGMFRAHQLATMYAKAEAEAAAAKAEAGEAAAPATTNETDPVSEDTAG